MNQIIPPPRIDIIPGARRFRRSSVPGSTAFSRGFCERRRDCATPEQGAAVMQGSTGDGDDGEGLARSDHADIASV